MVGENNMLNKKLFRTMWQYKAQFISMIIMTILGIAIFVALNVEWYTIDKNTKTFFDQTGFADFRVISAEGFLDEDLSKIQSIYGKDKATKYSELNVEVKNGENSKDDMLSVVSVSNDKVSGFILKQGEEYNPQDEEGIWLSEKYAAINDVSIDDEIELFYNGILVKSTVKGLIQSGEKLICVRDETQLMPDFDIFGYGYISPKMQEKFLGAEYYPQINVISSDTKSEFISKINNAIDKKCLITTKDENMSYVGSQGEVEEGKIMGSILPVIFLLISVLTMMTTMQRIVNKEKVQIGTLKALGFKNNKILAHYTLYTVAVGIISSILGVLAGYGLAYSIVNPNGSMGTYIDMPDWKMSIPPFAYIVIITINALLIIIGLMSVRKILTKSACEILRPSIGEKTKPMKIEKTKWFHNRSFGVRWNLRDILHHKSRTAMSLIGVVGCMIMLLASFGIDSTMAYSIDLQYNQAMQYNNKIYLSNDITKEETDKLIETYNAEWASSVGVKIEEKAIALDIYSEQNGLVQFMDENNQFVKINNDGVYICRRIAKEFNIGIGDNLVISSYQDDSKYTLKIAGILSSMSENIVMTETYAKSIDIPFKVSLLYTIDEDINMENGIKSIQSKKELISTFDTMFEMMDMMIVMLVGIGLILSTVVLYNLGVMGYTERYREMATLKVLGFRNKKISSLLISQNLWLSFVGIIIGLPLGYLTLEYLLVAMADDYEMNLHISTMSYIICVVLNMGVSLLVSIMVSRKNKNIDMVEALKINE